MGTVREGGDKGVVSGGNSVRVALIPGSVKSSKTGVAKVDTIRVPGVSSGMRIRDEGSNSEDSGVSRESSYCS